MYMTEKPQKPEKPFHDFPLFAHANGSWAKKINGKLEFFGSWRDDRNGKAALARYEAWLAKPLSIQATVEPSRPAAEPSKPMKPYADFPLYIVGGERWAKKIHGKPHYFGPVAGDEKGEAALVKWLAQKDDLLAGRKPRQIDDGSRRVFEVCDRFRQFHTDRVAAGASSNRNLGDIIAACDIAVGEFGANRSVADIRPEDFEKLRTKLEGRYRYHRLQKSIQKIRSLFKYGFDSGLLDRPLRFGAGFKLPPKAMQRRERRTKPKKFFEANQIRCMIDAAPTAALKAMILLGVNGGMDNAACGQLLLSDLNLDSGWLDNIREKTGEQRRFPLWPETVEALRAAIAERPEPKSEEYADYVFLTRLGQPWERDDDSRPLSVQFGRIIKKLGIHKEGLGFRTLRHVFQTIADNVNDVVATKLVMGHEDPSISTFYREFTRDERLAKVTTYVRDWLAYSAETQPVGA